MFDVAIIGAGPAGSTIARLLGRYFKIALLEKRDLERGKPCARNEKCCGGLLAPDAQKALAALSLGLPRSVIVDPQLFAVRSVDLASGRERYYQRHYINIDRLLFDRWLYSLVPERVARFPSCLIKELIRGPRGFTLRYMKKGRPGSLDARLVIGADGARSLVRSLIDGAGRIRRYFAVEEWFACPASPPFYSALFDPAITDFYAWTIPKNGELIVGAALDPEREPLKKFELLKNSLREHGLPLSRPLRKRSAFLLRPSGPGSIILGAGGLALAGEAAGLVSPSSGEGLSFALESAVLLASSILQYGENYEKAYARAAAGLRRKIALKILKAPFIYNPVLRRIIMRSGMQSIEMKGNLSWIREGNEAPKTLF